MQNQKANGQLRTGRSQVQFQRSPEVTLATLSRKRASWSEFDLTQIIPLPGLRPCASCGAFVSNVNLGGNNGKSALTGELFCLVCAD
ncbi:MAG TPA: hypothetical protein VLQ29_00190 [Candidatus Dormibacteraeota bacterium]|nr:hypothetical protein [Candidatus Dormibacteraeota bacterium]